MMLDTRAGAFASLKKNVPTVEANRCLLPVFAIEPIDCHIRSIAGDIGIFVSANAVDCFYRAGSLHVTHLFAIGTRTQQALQNKGFKNIVIPDIFSSDGLLQIPLLSNVSGKTIVIVCGENAKPLLFNTLEARGARITRIICYRRVPIHYNMTKTFSVLSHHPIQTVFSGSFESLQQLMMLFHRKAHHAWLLKKTLYVMTEKMREEAVRLGFAEVVLREGGCEGECEFRG